MGQKKYDYSQEEKKKSQKEQAPDLHAGRVQTDPGCWVPARPDRPGAWLEIIMVCHHEFSIRKWTRRNHVAVVRGVDPVSLMYKVTLRPLPFAVD